MRTSLEKNPAVVRLTRLAARRWPLLLSLYILVCTIGFSSWALIVLHRSSGDALSWPVALVWQSLSYLSWLPFVGLAWIAALRYALTYRLLALLYGLIVICSMVHALFVLWLNSLFANDQIGWTVFWNRLPIDLLLATAIAALVAAVYGHRLSREERERAEALQRALDNARLEAARPTPSTAQRLLVSTGVNSVPVDANAVEWFSSAGNYVVVNWQGKEGLIRETLSALSQRLDPAVFARTHRSTIVNLAKVCSTASLATGAWLLVTESGAELMISRTYRDAVLERLGRK